MAEFSRYRKTQIAEMRPYVAGEPLDGVSIADADRVNGSPTVGDFIARNPTDHADQWLVSAAFVAANYRARTQGDPMSFPYYDLVERAYHEFGARGQNRPTLDAGGVSSRTKVCSRAGRATTSSRSKHPDHRPARKRPARQYDSLLRATASDLLLGGGDGTFWDIATDTDGAAVPLNGGPGGPDPELIPRWRKPTAELAQITPGGGGQDLTSLAPPYDESKERPVRGWGAMTSTPSWRSAGRRSRPMAA